MVINSGVNVLSPNDELLSRLCSAIIYALADSELSKTACHCARSLLLTSPKSAGDQELVRLLLPQLISFLASEEPDTDSTRAAKDSITQTLVLFLPSLFGQQIQTALSLFIPAVLARATLVDKANYREIAGRLLEMAAVDQGAFKVVVAGLNSSQRSFLEEVLRSLSQGQTNGAVHREERGEPTIALKMNF